MGLIQASHTVEIEAELARVYEVAADIERAEQWMPSVQAVEVLETNADGDATLVELLVDAVVKKSKTTLSYSYSRPDSITWKQEKGEPKSLVGRWELLALSETRTQATYALEADPGRVLGLLLRGPVEGKVKEFLTKGAAEGLKEFCE